MAELHNPLFEDEKEFLERQKLEYERALLGDVDHLKERSQQVGKYALIGAGLAGSIWLISKAFGSKKSHAELHEEDQEFARLRHESKKSRKTRAAAPPYSAIGTTVGDDLGFGAGQHQYDRGRTAPVHERADIGPDVYHTHDATESDPFQPVASYGKTRPVPAAYAPAPSSEAANMAASALQSFLQSDTGKMLIAQVTAVLMAYVAKKVGDYLPMVKNPDLATSPSYTTTEPETKDIDFTYHHDEADAPHQSS